MKIRFKKSTGYNTIWDIQRFFLFFWVPTFKFVSSADKNPTVKDLADIYKLKYTNNLTESVEL